MKKLSFAPFLSIIPLLFLGCKQPKPVYQNHHKKHVLRYVIPEYLKPLELRGLSCDYQKAVVVGIRNGKGRFFACEDYIVTRNGPVTSGVPGTHDTPKGEFTVKWKAKEYDSKTYPSSNGRRNMDYALFITNKGVALHAGNVHMLSHGCVHLRRADARYLYENFNSGDSVFID